MLYLCSMSEYCIYLKMPPYLRQWFIHRHGGNDPVTLRRGSIESKLFQRVTVPLPPMAIPARKQEGEVAILIPYSKSHAPRYYNHVTETFLYTRRSAHTPALSFCYQHREQRDVFDRNEGATVSNGKAHLLHRFA